jgi:cytochrome c
MKHVAFTALLILLAGCAQAPSKAPEPQVSAELGKALFNDPKLGTTGGTCNSCHPDGGTIGGKVAGMPIPDLHGSAETFPKFKEWAGREVTLAEMNNFCIVQVLKGQELDPNSVEMKALEAYLHTLKGPSKAGAPGYG